MSIGDSTLRRCPSGRLRLIGLAQGGEGKLKEASAGSLFMHHQERDSPRARLSLGLGAHGVLAHPAQPGRTQTLGDGTVSAGAKEKRGSPWVQQCGFFHEVAMLLTKGWS